VTTTDKRWYVVRTYSGHENKVKAYLENEVAQSKLGELITSVIVPSEKVFEVKDGKKKSKTRTFFPGYILVEAILDKVTTHLILNTPSVISFVGPNNQPAPLQASEIRM
jgi:transcriptional antiterminator NusG